MAKCFMWEGQVTIGNDIPEQVALDVIRKQTEDWIDCLVVKNTYCIKLQTIGKQGMR